MKIGVLYICTGKYTVFWRDFYLSCEKYFLPETKKEYFVFTDSQEIDYEIENPNKIHRYYRKFYGWPDDTLMRYEMFLNIKEELLKFDYLFFFNSNLEFLRKIEPNEVLPQGNENLVACLHPGYFDKKAKVFTYERNSNSTAFIPYNKGKNYFAGGVNGGKSKEFILAMESMITNIKIDLAKSIRAIWLDESHWNRYLLDRNDFKILTPSYLYPEGWILPFEKVTILRDKKKYIDYKEVGKKTENFFIRKIKNLIKNIYKRSRIVKIHGGLGNQMFQYVYGRNMELSGKKVVFDTSFFAGNKTSKDTARNYKLNKFNLQTNIEFSEKSHPILDFWVKIKRRLGLNADIYFQSEKYFINIADIIKRELVLKKPLSNKAQGFLSNIENNNSVSLHVRRGDYVTDKNINAFHGTCDVDYYEKAISLIKEKVNSPVFFVFSDDIAWAKDNFKGSEFVLVSSPEIEDVEELILMSKCKHNIIANSSFSWWGAWLNSNLNKIIIAPKNWFNNEKANKNNDIIPDKWIKI